MVLAHEQAAPETEGKEDLLLPADILGSTRSAQVIWSWEGEVVPPHRNCKASQTPETQQSPLLG